MPSPPPPPRLANPLSWVALPFLLGGLTGLVAPQIEGIAPPQGAPPALAALLAVAAIALFAGRTWGLLLGVAAHLALVGRIWPAALAGAEATGTLGTVGNAIVLATALPALALAALVFPSLVDEVLGDVAARVRSLATGGAALALAVALVAPALVARVRWPGVR